MDIKVKIVTALDQYAVDRMTEIEAQAFGEGGLNIWMLVPLIRHGRVFVLYGGEEIIGGAQFLRDWDDPSRTYLVGIAIDRRYRGQGLGTRFLGECLSVLKSEGVASVELTVDAANKPAVRVYSEKLGFDTQGVRKDEYGAGVDRVVMMRAL